MKKSFDRLAGLRSLGSLTTDAGLVHEDLVTYLMSHEFLKVKELGNSVYNKQINLSCSPSEWGRVLSKVFGDTTKFFAFQDERESIVISKTEDSKWFLIFTRFNSNVAKCAVYTKSEFQLTQVADMLKAEHDEIITTVNWLYDSHGSTMTVPLQTDTVPVDEMYPWLGDGKLTDIYDGFMNSRASIMLLYGPPGTGKTTFIKGLLHHAQISALVSYDTTILSKDAVFADFVEGKNGVFVMEDTDVFLTSRESGNTTMQKFLNVGDGLMTMAGKKIIFSTNLGDIKDVDAALLRPGRCFSAIEFGTLTHEEAVRLAARMNISPPEFVADKRWTIAEVFNPNHDSSSSDTVVRKKTSMGFMT